ncbi:MAG: hypothetical protein J6Y32_02585 [Bacteroidales bacterium]|nr:hypothetical protein [Bacteroidales bacterium]
MNENIFPEGAPKRHPYKVPEGYFEDFQAKMSHMAREQKTVPVSTWMRIKPYVALAASFLLLLGIGSFLLKSVTPAAEDNLLAAYEEVLPNSDEELVWLSQYEEDDLSEEDIAEYLDYIGTSVEDFYTEWL